MSVSPSPSYTGSYTVSWTGTLGCRTIGDVTRCIYLYEKAGSGSWKNIDGTSGRTSRSFSGKAVNTYQYKIVRILSTVTDIEGPVSVQVKKPTTPSTPTGPSTDNNGAYTISWGSSTGASYYQLQEYLSSWSTIVSANQTSVARSGRGNGIWYYRARACSTVGCSGWTANKSVIVANTPGIPSSISAPATDNDGAFTVSWGSASGSVTAYQTYQQKDGGSWVNIYNSTGLSKAVSGLGDGSYKFRVHACKTVSSYTSCSSYRTTAGSTVVTNVPGMPGTITGPDSDADGAFSLSWGAASGIVDTYKLWRRSDGGAWGLIQDSITRSKTENLTESGIYDYYAEACNVSGCGSNTPIKSVSVYIPLPPPSAPEWNLAPTSSDFGDYDISWSASTGTVSYYTLEEGINASGTWTNVPLTTSLSYDARGKLEGEYGYRVQSCNVDACSPWSTIHNIDVHNLQGVAPAVSIAIADEPGTTAYSTGVSSQGNALVNIPVRIYPGVNGLQPGLSISYSSGRPRQQIDEVLPEDILGYGWSLDGLSAIRRCVKDRTDVSDVQLDNTDSLCLDGEPLVAIAGTYLQPGAEYRTLRESYTKIEQLGTAAAPWFRVTGPDGTVSEYGHTNDSQVQVIDAVQTSPYFIWSLNARTDSFGNAITYSYHKDQLSGINYPLSIDYAGVNISFHYATRDDAAPMPLATIEQGQLVLLHTIEVKLNNILVREYRLASEVAPEGWRRLSQAQECGYDETGTVPTCLASLLFDWLTAGVQIPEDFKTGVQRITDGLGAITEFDHGVITETGSHPFLFLERPFGAEIAIPDTSGVTPSADGSLKCVVIEQRRSDGLGGLHRTTYAYHGRGLMSTRNWGFLGFYSQRIKDEASGIVTYRQFRQDYPYFGRTSAMSQYDATYGSHNEQLSRQEAHYAYYTSSQGTDLPYVSDSISFIFEKDTTTGYEVQLGAEQQSNSYVFDVNGFIDTLSTTTRVAETVSVTAAGGSYWGDVPTYSLSGILRSGESDIIFNNRTASGQWLIGFPNSAEVRSYRGDNIPANLDRTQNVDMSPYQATNAVATITRFPGDIDYELTSTHGYDVNGNRTSSSVVGINVPSRTSSALNFSESRYPGTLRNALLKDTGVVYDLRFGAAKHVTDPNGRIIQVSYDAFGRETQRVTPDNVTITTAYDFCDISTCDPVNGVIPAYRIQTSSAISPVRSQYMDALGRVVRTEVASFLGTDVIRQDTYYDSQGRVDRVTQPYFSINLESFTILTYDLRNRVINTQRPDGSSTTAGYDADSLNNRVTVTVDNLLKAANGTSAGTQTKTSHYNILSELISTTDAAGTTDAITSTWQYDGSGLPLFTTVDNGQPTSYQYDNAGNRTHITGPNIGTVESRYTALGQVRYQQDNKLQETTSLYDVLGRLTSRTDADGIANWTYDPVNAFGALHTRTNNNGFTETHTYNTSAQLSNSQTAITVPGYTRSYNQGYLYDSQGRVDKISYPSGIQVQYGYNARGYLESLTDTASTTVLQAFNDTDAFGNVKDEQYGNGIQTQRLYNAQTGRLESINTTLGVTALQDNVYAWRSDGSLESRINYVGATKQETFAYDALNRMQEAKTYLSGSLSRTLNTGYDRLGNITFKTSSIASDVDVTGYQYGATSNAGPHAVSNVTIDGIGTTLYYDANGNVTEYDAASGDDKYLNWNARNLPTIITVGASAVTATPSARDEFQYGPNGQRYYKKSTYQASGGQRIEHTFYAGSFEEVIPEVAPDLTQVKKTQVTETVLHIVTDNLIGTIVESVEYLHRDHLGSVEVITDESGNELQVLAYDPFGERRNSDWAGAIGQIELDAVLDNLNIRTSRGFTGHEHLDRTGIIHMNGRTYDPKLGRFLSPDPLVQAPTNSQSWNRYSYVFNNPLSFVDPSGFASGAPLKCIGDSCSQTTLPEVISHGTMPKITKTTPLTNGFIMTAGTMFVMGSGVSNFGSLVNKARSELNAANSACSSGYGGRICTKAREDAEDALKEYNDAIDNLWRELANVARSAIRRFNSANPNAPIPVTAWDIYAILADEARGVYANEAFYQNLSLGQFQEILGRRDGFFAGYDQNTFVISGSSSLAGTHLGADINYSYQGFVTAAAGRSRILMDVYITGYNIRQGFRRGSILYDTRQILPAIRWAITGAGIYGSVTGEQ